MIRTPGPRPVPVALLAPGPLPPSPVRCRRAGANRRPAHADFRPASAASLLDGRPIRTSDRIPQGSAATVDLSVPTPDNTGANAAREVPWAQTLLAEAPIHPQPGESSHTGAPVPERPDPALAWEADRPSLASEAFAGARPLLPGAVSLIPEWIPAAGDEGKGWLPRLSPTLPTSWSHLSPGPAPPGRGRLRGADHPGGRPRARHRLGSDGLRPPPGFKEKWSGWRAAGVFRPPKSPEWEAVPSPPGGCGSSSSWSEDHPSVETPRQPRSSVPPRGAVQPSKS